jgi:hypothetical protein
MRDMRPVLTLINEEKSEFLSSLNSSKIKYEITAHNFQEIIDRERRENDMNKRMTRAFDYSSSFHTYEEIVSELKRITTNSELYFSEEHKLTVSCAALQTQFWLFVSFEARAQAFRRAAQTQVQLSLLSLKRN